MNQSLDGYVDHEAFAPSPVLFRHFIEHVRDLSGSLYGRRMYEIMRVWDEVDPTWDADELDFSAAWRRQPKWVVSSSSRSIGPHATLIAGELETRVRRLKAEQEGEIDVAGPALAASLTDLGLIDEYRIYLHPLVLGQGARFFTRSRPPLRLLGVDPIGEVLRLSYAPA